MAGIWEVTKVEDAFSVDMLNINIGTNQNGSTTNSNEVREITIEIEKDSRYILKSKISDNNHHYR